MRRPWILSLSCVGLALLLGIGLAWRFGSPSPEDLSLDDEPPPGDRGQELYARHCIGCHGARGDSQGAVSVYLNPRPRPFGDLEFRLITTRTRLPSDADLRRLLEEGIPGSGMFAFPHLPEEDLEALVAHLRRLIRRGVESRLRTEGVIDPAQLREAVNRRTDPGEPLTFPATFLETTPESRARGEGHYRKLCQSCHGATGRGEGAPALVNNDRTAAKLPDLTQGIFKGGNSPRALYARIRLGMPGTPMPGFPDLSDNEVQEVIHYLQGLSAAAPRRPR